MLVFIQPVTKIEYSASFITHLVSFFMVVAFIMEPVISKEKKKYF